MGAFGIFVAVSALIALAALMSIGKQAGYSNEAQALYLNYSYMQEISTLGLSATLCNAMNASSAAEFYSVLEASARLDDLNTSMQGNIITIYKDSYPNTYEIIDCG